MVNSIAWRLSFWQIICLSLILLLVSGCTGEDGKRGKTGAPGAPGTVTVATPTALNFTITSVTINSSPVVNFTVKDGDDLPFAGLTDTDLRFNISKLIPAAASPDGTSQWQNYILISSFLPMIGWQERTHSPPSPLDIWGELVNHGDGTYTYTFATDITNAPCPGPCTEADGTPLDLSYQPDFTHRVTVQQANEDLPLVNAVYDFVPSGGSVTSERLIIKTDNCNECHDKITHHGPYFETKLCVTCHNPGMWVDANTPLDFKVMIHKVHRGEELPSVVAGGTYAVGANDFSDVVFPQDIRNCTKCHDGSDVDTPQGNNWQTPNMDACGSCHDDIDFSVDGSACYPDDTVPACDATAKMGHPGGIVTDNSECVTCHATGRIAGSVAESHTVPGKVERGYFKFNILKICGVAADANPVCAPSSNPTITFSVTDPTGATTHEYGNAYNVRSTGTDPEFTSSSASLNLLIAWDTRDYTNEGGSGSLPARADSVNLRTSAAVTYNGDGTFTVDGAAASKMIPAGATGSGAMAIEGHPAAKDETGAYSVRVPVNSEVSYFAITDSTPKPRRMVVDVATKCDRCHDVLSVHGSSRNNNGQLCVLCHNPSNTDVSQRPKDAVTGLPDASATLDGKTEESIDFKRLIHGIHAASASNFDGTSAHGFREKGLVVYGYGGSAHDFSDIRFPGVLTKCDTCHLEGGDPIGDGSTTADYDTYVLEDHSADGGANWELPAMNGIQGSTVNSYPTAAADGSDFDARLAQRDDDYKYSPIASICSACHDGTLQQQHMSINGAILGGAGSEQPVQVTNIETCPICHGPGKLADVELVHNQAFE